MEDCKRFLCHACGLRFAEEQTDLSCPRCGDTRNMIETLDVCERCNGHGEIINESEHEGPIGMQPCRRCEGSGVEPT